MPVHLRAVCKFTGTWSPHMHHTAVSSPSCLGTRRGEMTRQNPKSLSIILFFVHDLWKYLLILAMIIPATLIINMGDFTIPHQCWKFSQKSCRPSSLESQIINIKSKKNYRKVPGPPPKLSASDWRTCGNFQHCPSHFYATILSPLSFLSINFWHSDMMTIFFYNVSIIVPWISK